ncbi:TetR family transcriptional regulator [Olivibacter sp. XZL3]|uniref:TetR family transcriptional regulator n=1 Tax=Olivibacter sp. XZL3 TaxID=1735116 RepID=UPI0010668F01|nr:TetR family transcriptional regulator [Olivibacter sp. XZL3]
MGRKSIKDTRKQEIIQSFYKVSKKIGYNNTSIAKVAKEMDINPSLIIHYFATKEDLKNALIDYLLERYLLIFKIDHEKDYGLEELHQIVDRLFSKKWNKLFDDSLFYDFYAESFRNKKIKRKYIRILDSLRSALTIVLTKLNEQQLLKLTDPSHTADLIFIFLDGAYFYLSLVEDKALIEKRLTQYKEEIYDLLGLSR